MKAFWAVMSNGTVFVRCALGIPPYVESLQACNPAAVRMESPGGDKPNKMTYVFAKCFCARPVRKVGYFGLSYICLLWLRRLTRSRVLLCERVCMCYSRNALRKGHEACQSVLPKAAQFAIPLSARRALEGWAGDRRQYLLWLNARIVVVGDSLLY